VVDQLVTIASAALIAKTAIKWLRDLIEQKTAPVRGLENVPPGSLIALIFSRDHWDKADLANLASIGDADASRLLKLFGFCWDRQVMKYCKSDASATMLDVLTRRRKDITWFRYDRVGKK
jgi:hypothetical protein